METSPQSHLESDVFARYGGEVKTDDAGNVLVDETSLPSFESQLAEHGVLAEVPTQEQIQAGIERAKGLTTERAVAELAADKFIGEKQFQAMVGQEHPLNFKLEKELFVNPDSIKGASGHDSWVGRGQLGQGEVKDRENGVIRSSIAKAMDFARQDTQLPKLDFLSLQLLLTPEGPILYSDGSSHRISAAKLRREPLRFDSLSIYDLR